MRLVINHRPLILSSFFWMFLKRALILSALVGGFLLVGHGQEAPPPPEDPQVTIDRLTKENEMLKNQLNMARQEMMRRGSTTQPSPDADARAVERKSKELVGKGFDPSGTFSEAVISEFDASEDSSAEKYAKLGVFKLEGYVTGFEFEMGSDGGGIVLTQTQGHKVVVRLDREQIRQLRPVVVPGKFDPYAVPTGEGHTPVGFAHYDASKNAVMMDVDTRQSTGQPVSIVSKKIVGVGDPFIATVQFDRVQEGRVIFVVNYKSLVT